jgi:hypothetical protein
MGACFPRSALAAGLAMMAVWPDQDRPREAEPLLRELPERKARDLRHLERSRDRNAAPLPCGVLVMLWQLDDGEAYDFMMDFNRNWLGQDRSDPARALRDTQPVTPEGRCLPGRPPARAMTPD